MKISIPKSAMMIAFILGASSLCMADTMVGKLTSEQGKLVLIVEKSGASTTYILDKKNDNDEMRDHLNDDMQVEGKIKVVDNQKVVVIESYKVLDDTPPAQE